MKRMVMLIVAVIFLFSVRADACVGKMLNIGVLNSPEGQVLAELLSTLINERTGTTLTVKLYKNAQDIYEAVKVKQVDISIENTARAMQLLKRPVENDVNKDFEIVKATYEKEKGLVWLKPFGFSRGGGGVPSYTSTLLTIEVYNNFPALPRVINKLGSSINDEAYTKLIKAVESGEKPKKVARDFLKSKKLI